MIKNIWLTIKRAVTNKWAVPVYLLMALGAVGYYFLIPYRGTDWLWWQALIGGIFYFQGESKTEVATMDWQKSMLQNIKRIVMSGIEYHAWRGSEAFGISQMILSLGITQSNFPYLILTLAPCALIYQYGFLRRNQKAKK